MNEVGQTTETIQAQQAPSQAEAPAPKSIGNPDLSQAEYESLRREGITETQVSAKEPVDQAKSAPEVTTSEQKEATDSEPEATEVEESEEHETDSETEQSNKPKKKGGWQKRIDKKTKENAELKQRIAYLEQLALKGAGTEPKEAPKVEKKSDATDVEPNPESFETHKEWATAHAKWVYRQEKKEDDQKAAKQKAESEQQTLSKSHADRVKAFADKTDDFHEMMENLNDVPRSAAIESIIVASENGPEILYELAKNPAEAKRIATLPPLQAAREMGKIESRLSSNPSEAPKEPKKITNAPKPISTLGTGGKGSVAKTIYDADIDQKTYERLRAEELKKRRRA